jgi:glycosyltransferase involved in cell wall biosynthesis
MVQVGRLSHEQKGQDIALHALSYLINSLNIKKVSIDFIGNGNSEVYLRDLAEKLKVSDHCSFIGLKHREWIYNHLCDYELLVQPSRYEGFGLTVAEAMAAKVPVLVSDIEGPLEIIEYGKYGYTFKSEDAKDLAQKILSIQEKYGAVAFNEKIMNGYSHIVKLYDIIKTSSNYLMQYKLRRN